MPAAVLLHPERAVLNGYEHSHSAGVDFFEERQHWPMGEEGREIVTDRAEVAPFSIALVELLKVLHDRGVIAVSDWDRVVDALTDRADDDDVPPSHRAAIEELSETLRRHHPRSGGFQE
jgi:hypothetical protein